MSPRRSPGRSSVGGESSRARGGRSVVEEFVNCPLVVGVLSIVECSYPPVGSDQDIRRQSEATAGGADRSQRGALGAVLPERGSLTGDRRAEGGRAQQRAQSTPDTEAHG